MIEKRFFFVIDNGEYTFYDLNENGEIMNMNETEDMLNELHEENQSIKKYIRDLYKIVKIDVDNEIEVYPKALLEYIVNILKIIGDDYDWKTIY